MSSSPNSSSSSEPGPFGPMLDVACDVEVLVGTGSLTVRECLQLRQGSILRLFQTAGADMQISVNGVPIAQGEVMVLDDSTAVRVTEVLPPPSTESRS